MCPRGCWQEPVAWPRVLFVSPWARSAARSSDRSVARSMGRLAVSLLSPAAPEASACSVAGIRWALEDLVASCLHHRQWHEVQARSKLAPSLFMPPCLSALARPGLSALARPGLLHTKSVFVTGYGLCHFLTSCVFSRPRTRPPHQRTCSAGAGFPTPALPDKRAQRHSMQDTQPETSVPSSAIWRSRM